MLARPFISARHEDEQKMAKNPLISIDTLKTNSIRLLIVRVSQCAAMCRRFGQLSRLACFSPFHLTFPNGFAVRRQYKVWNFYRTECVFAITCGWPIWPFRMRRAEKKSPLPVMCNSSHGHHCSTDRVHRPKVSIPRRRSTHSFFVNRHRSLAQTTDSEKNQKKMREKNFNENSDFRLPIGFHIRIQMPFKSYSRPMVSSSFGWFNFVQRTQK